MASVTRFRLPSVTDEVSSVGGSRYFGPSHTGDLDADKDVPEDDSLYGGDTQSDTEELVANPAEIIRRLEELHSRKTAPQQPNPELDSLLARVLAGRPELRPRLAVMAKSALLRTKILTIPPAGGRAMGSGGLGITHHWRREKLADNFTDHNWPKASLNSTNGMYHLSGGSSSHDALLRSPADKIRKNPTMSSPSKFSVPKAKRFPTAKEQADREFEIKARQPPGPGHYLKTVPRGTAFTKDGGETVVLGANHPCPWKGCLTNQINATPVDFTTGTHAPAFTFPKTRRTITEVNMGMAMNAVKSDLYNLSPGPIYELTASISPTSGPTMGMRKKSASVPSFQRVRPVRMVYCPPEPDAQPLHR